MSSKYIQGTAEDWLSAAAISNYFYTSRAVILVLRALMKESKEQYIDRLFDLACKHGSAEVVRMMLRRALGALYLKVQSTVAYQQRIFSLAASHSQTHIISLLLDHALDPNRSNPSSQPFSTATHSHSDSSSSVVHALRPRCSKT